MPPPATARAWCRASSGKTPLDRPGHADDVPLQALGGMHRHELDRVGCRRRPDVVAVLGLFRRIERGQESAEIRLPLESDEIGSDVKESEHVSPPSAAQPGRARLQLDVESDRPFDIGDQVRQRLLDPAGAAPSAHDAIDGSRRSASGDSGASSRARESPAARARRTAHRSPPRRHRVCSWVRSAPAPAP